MDIPGWIAPLAGALLGGAVAWGVMRAQIQTLREDHRAIKDQLADLTKDKAAGVVLDQWGRETTQRHENRIDKFEERLRELETRCLHHSDEPKEPQ